MDLIDRTITPDPFNPQPGDVYRRDIDTTPNPRTLAITADRLMTETPPARIVFKRIAPTEGDSGRIWMFVDGRETYKTPAELPIWLASIDGMEPFGRVRTEAT